MIIRLFIVALAAVVGTAASAATFTPSTVTEVQTALTTAQANGEDDTIYIQAGTYNLTEGPWTYTAAMTEMFGLNVYGDDSTTTIIDGGNQVPLLRIDTTAVSSGSFLNFNITNMTFQNGYATGAEVNGGALEIEVLEMGFLVIAASEFYTNWADGDGGAIYIEGNFVEGISLTDLTIQDNEAFGTADGRRGDGGGAAIRAAWPAYVGLSDIDFFFNEAAGFGGGLEVEGVDDATGTQQVDLYDIMFEGNVITGTGSGGGASLFAMDVWINLVGFVENTATDLGGGLHLREQSRNRTINSGFVDNQARAGGGYGTDTWDGSGLVLEHTTFTGNIATDYGGGIYMSRGLPNPQVFLYNNIVWGNTGPLGADIYVDDDPNDAGGDQVTQVELFNNLYTDFTTKCRENVECTDRVIETDNIVGPDPLITDDLHLLMGSPAIDAGLNTGHPMYPVVDFDYDGDARPFDGDGDSVATTDIGIDEYVGGEPTPTDVAITMTDSPDPVLAGGQVTYTMTVTNNGPGDVTGVTAVFAELENLHLSVDLSQGSFTGGFGLVRWTVGDLASGASATATIVIQHTEDQGSQTLISAEAYLEDILTDPDSSNNQVTVETTVVQPSPDTADLAITMTDSDDPVVSGGLWFAYEMTVTNNGPNAATGVTVTDILPMGLTDIIGSVSLVPGEWRIDLCVVNGLQVTCTIGDLAVDEQVLVRVEAIPEPVQADTDIVNTASVSGDQADPVSTNNSVMETTTVAPAQSDMTVEVVATPAEPEIGDRVTYDITIWNSGPSHNTDVVLSITLPSMGTFVSATANQGTCSAPVKGVIDCDLGNMPLSFFPATVQVVFTAPNVAASMVLSASVTGAISDPSGGNNSDSDAVTVIDTVDIIIEGESEGGGAFGWLWMLLLTATALVLRSMRTARYATPCLLAVAALMLVPAGNAVAQGNLYVQGSFGWTDLDYDESDLTSDLASRGWTINSPDVDSDDQAFKIMVGFAFNEYVAVEGGYADLGEVETRFGATVLQSEIPAILNDTLDVHPYQGDGFVVAGVLHWPVNPDVVSLYAKAGFFMWESETDVEVVQGGTGSVYGEDDGTDLMWGVGAEWKINPTWSLTAEWERYEMNEWLDVPFIGVKFNF